MKIFPSSNEKTITFVIISFMTGAILGFIISNKTTDSGVLLTAIATLAAAFFGAFAAYKLEDNNKKREIKSNQLEQANHVIFALYERIVFLKGFQKNFIDPHRNNPAKMVSMRPALNIERPDSVLNVTDILYLLGTKHEQLVLDLHLEKERFNTAFGLVSFRSNLHLNEVQPALENKGIREGEDYSIRQLIDAMGERLFASLERGTDNLIENVDETILSHMKVKENLVSALKEVHPGKNIMNYRISN